ncbi:MAG: TIGR04222 domain-containing membrane protein [Erythrobacter sp.]|nr:TIGR04222 domain-containing membrane protein [Erythrobacter sp.]
MELFSSWTGSDFLQFYIMLLVLSAVAGWWIPAQLRPAGRASESLDAEDLAMLGGGRERFADSLLADLFVRGGLAAVSAGKLEVVQPGLPASPAGKALLAYGAPISASAASKAVGVHAERVAARLRRSGLLLRPEELTQLRWLSIAPFCALLLLGLYRQRAGSAEGEATGFLVILMVLTAGLALLRFFKVDHRTRAGIAAVQGFRARAARLSAAPRPEEVATAVALFGTGVLVGTPWEPVHAMRHQSGGGDGGSSDSSSDGGSDGGGGGCGGCGG